MLLAENQFFFHQLENHANLKCYSILLVELHMSSPDSFKAFIDLLVAS